MCVLINSNELLASLSFYFSLFFLLQLSTLLPIFISFVQKHCLPRCNERDVNEFLLSNARHVWKKFTWNYRQKFYLPRRLSFWNGGKNAFPRDSRHSVILGECNVYTRTKFEHTHTHTSTHEYMCKLSISRASCFHLWNLQLEINLKHILRENAMNIMFLVCLVFFLLLLFFSKFC